MQQVCANLKKPEQNASSKTQPPNAIDYQRRSDDDIDAMLDFNNVL